MRQSADQLREELKQKEKQREEAETTLTAVRAESASKRLEQERQAFTAQVVYMCTLSIRQECSM